MVMAATTTTSEADGDSEAKVKSLKYKTWLLKVSIHCEGCKKKVKRVLHGIEGVYTVDVDVEKDKVVVTGNVEAVTLIKKLEKSGKHAELWPHQLQNHERDKKKSQNQTQFKKKKSNNTTSTADDHKDDVVNKTGQKPPQNSQNSDHPKKSPPDTRQQTQEELVKETADKASNVNVDAGVVNGTGKKKKNKGHEGNSNPNPGGQGQEKETSQSPSGCKDIQEGSIVNNKARASTNSSEQQPISATDSGSGYNYNYNMASHPYTASYYAAHHQPSYYSITAGLELGNGPGPGSFYLYGHHQSQSQSHDTFEMFSDENPNACSVM